MIRDIVFPQAAPNLLRRTVKRSHPAFHTNDLTHTVMPYDIGIPILIHNPLTTELRLCVLQSYENFLLTF